MSASICCLGKATLIECAVGLPNTGRARACAAESAVVLALLAFLLQLRTLQALHLRSLFLSRQIEWFHQAFNSRQRGDFGAHASRLAIIST